MNKLFTKIAGVVLGLTLTIGVGLGAGQHEPQVVHAAAAEPDTGYTLAELGHGTASSDCTVNGYDGIKVGTSSKGGSLIVTVPAGATKLRVYAAAWKGVSGLSLTIEPADNISPSSIALKADTGVTSNSPFTLKDNEEAYYCHDFNLINVVSSTSFTFTTSIAKRFVMWKAQYIAASADTKVVVDSLDLTTTDIDANGVALATTYELEAAVSYVTGDGYVNGTGDVDWVSSNESVATISSGKAIVVGNGTSTLTATTKELDENGEAISKSVTITVTNAAGTSEENPFNITQAKNAIDVLTTPTNVYAKGIVSQVDSFNSTYGSITYWISDDGTTNNQFEVYSGLDLDNTKFTAVTDLTVGTEVVVFGNMKLYSSTYEFDKNNYIVSKVVKELTAITVSQDNTKKEYFGGEQFDIEGLVVYASYNGTIDTSLNIATSIQWENGGVLSTGQTSITGYSSLDPNQEFAVTISGLTVTEKVYVNTYSIEGQYRIKSTGKEGSETYYLQENGTSAAPSATQDLTKATIFDVTLVGDDTLCFTVKNTTNVLYSTDANNGARIGSGANSSWTITENDGTFNGGNYILTNVALSRVLSLYSTQDFRTYTTDSSKTAIDLEKVEELAEIESIVFADYSTHKTSFYVGETFSTNGVTLIVTDTNENSAAVTEGFTSSLSSDYVFTASDIGTKTVTLTYEGVNISYEINVSEKLAGIEKTYTFSEYTAGEQYAEGEAHDLKEGVLTLTTTQCHFTTDLRVYSSSEHDGFAIFDSTRDIISITFNAGYKADTVNVYTSNEGTPLTFETTTSYADHTVSFGEPTKFVKIDVAGTSQVRFKYVTVEYVATSATSFSNKVLSSTNTICSDNGAADHKSELTPVWAELEAELYFVTDASKEELKTLSDEGMQRYDHIVSRYGLTNFLNRAIVNNSNNLLLSADSNNQGVLILVVMITAAGIGICLAIKRKKNQLSK